MYLRDYRDIIGGGLLIALGLWSSFYALAHYDTGTLRHMGPGMFPTWLGFILAGLGVLVLVPALFRPGPRVEIDYRQFVAVVLGVLFFALAVDYFGMIPAIVVLTIAAALADNKLGIVSTVLLIIGLSIIALLIFRLGLGITLQPFKWPF